jgi:hypothetical protein
MTKYWDINVWFKDFGHDEHGVNQWSDTITLNPAIYVLGTYEDSSLDTVYKVYTGILYECNAEETAKIREHRSQIEYGDDWWDFRDELRDLDISQGINDLLDDLPDPYSINIDGIDGLYEIDSMDKLHNLVG